ncbi:TPA: phosphatase PAP2 family protein [Burkholderia cepacia]|uniref:Phosphatase PAP2 family protein n=1 Tax=Burkholderia cepacia TaxID=292 RepID=A0AAX2RHU4_BURCE|nr:phosphatase PAP2 family protein [Burkholderia cepacia]AIO30029.1 PAP2 superfamily protein [Burkholderia cepacia ATCC 25416]ALK20837.1 phosphoesterase [Burkholderia cepacia ATCC 25416]ASE99095.1 phosphatase PAP2 family protein [Burkholderia cepacia]ATF82637.1 phosphoesterase [Burkholderia cepacia]KVX57162.1 phosphoesterase [Burkholderia cepacia]
MNNFDTTIQTFLTHITFGPLMNHAIRVIAGLYTFKGFVLIPVLCWLWFQPGPNRERQRELVVATIASGLVALAFGRLLAQVLPFRVRPIYNPELHLHFPSAGLRAATLQAWSSFPSDHAMLWMAIATGIFIIARRVGVLALLYAVVFICVPRAYLGFHYPTDLIAGAAIGIAIAWLLTRDAIRSRFAPQVLATIRRFPAPAYTLAFLLCFELITQFDELLTLAQSATRTM